MDINDTIHIFFFLIYNESSLEFDFAKGYEDIKEIFDLGSLKLFLLYQFMLYKRKIKGKPKN